MPQDNDHTREWTRLATHTDQAVEAGLLWLRTQRLTDFHAYADAAIPLIEEVLPAYLDRWGERLPGPGLAPVPVPVVKIAVPLVQQHHVAADHHAVVGQVREARALRVRGEALAGRHLTDVQRAEHWTGGHAEHLFAEGHIARAMDLLVRADGLLCAGDRRLAAVGVRLTHARLLRELGDHDKALLLLEGFEEWLRTQQRPGEGRVCLENGQEWSLPDLARAVEAEQRFHLLQRLLDLKAGLFADTERYAEAERLYRELRPGMEPFAGLQLASLAWRRGDAGAAGELLDALAPVFEDSEVSKASGPSEGPAKLPSGYPEGALAFRRTAYCLVRARVANASEEALDWCAVGLSTAADLPQPDLEWKLHAERARLLRSAERFTSAQAAYGEAVRIVDQRRRVSTGLRWDNSYLAERLPVLHEALDLAVERRDALAALGLIDMLKARSFAARLALLPVPGADAPTADERELAEVTAELNALEYGDVKSEPGPDAAARATGARELRIRRRRLVERIRRDDPRWRAVTEGAPVDFEEAVGAVAERVWRLPGDPGVPDGRGRRAALSLYRKQGRVVAVVVSPDGVEVGARVLSGEVVRALEEYGKRLRESAGVDVDRTPLDFSPAFGVALEDLVPRRLVEAALAADTLLVVPHADLHGLPWQLLTALGRPLVRHTAVGVLPNLAGLPTLDRPPARSVRVSLFGVQDQPEHLGLSQLVQVEGELCDLERLYGSERLLSRTAAGARADVRTLLGLLDRQGGPGTVLHLTCHTTAAGDDPYDAGLHLADGRLGIAQLAVRRVRYDEVVLAACSGAQRPSGTVRAEGRVQVVGDDAITLAHVFQEAGAAFVLGSPAPVGDRSARAFGLAWHRHRLGGASPLRAVRAAACDLLDEGRLARHNWAGFTGFGCR
ncbi:CHAT domain-containing protein [Streptomyces phaeochromogenes]|uniref:CHAT domain-containing protein n=1 Tax=Streptomyces phaeochromogenes TaxID=1923 RepID=UPI0033D5D19E